MVVNLCKLPMSLYSQNLLERTMLCTHQSLPAHPKPLPRPCPQCGLETGGCQLVVFNPKYQKVSSGYRPWKPIVVLRISHGYSKELRTKSGKRKKIWHNFQTDAWGLTIGDGPDSRCISTDAIFDQPGYEYTWKVLPSLFNLVILRNSKPMVGRALKRMGHIG